MLFPTARAFSAIPISIEISGVSCEGTKSVLSKAMYLLQQEAIIGDKDPDTEPGLFIFYRMLAKTVCSKGSIFYLVFPREIRFSLIATIIRNMAVPWSLYSSPQQCSPVNSFLPLFVQFRIVLVRSFSLSVGGGLANTGDSLIGTVPYLPSDLCSFCNRRLFTSSQKVFIITSKFL